ncbi:hypothetical protein PMI42_00860 [Bradyrhizobium sp. YR681]|uniref:hypothetical protein n=1 Tax=Bradyrhizobium sp. YR681 TaxID=1144344 RepID=UPI000270FD11|nr:hypothetical protein [Bradyrhizobium sp. YR681]EJN15568.1 hypothetical protein PMI42_00860 [Bradyrhizobium sp. YR681]
MSIRCTVESAFFIAWNFLERTGELGPPDETANLLLDAIEAQLRRGERRQLMLANKAIDAWRLHAAKGRPSPKAHVG